MLNVLPAVVRRNSINLMAAAAVLVMGMVLGLAIPKIASQPINRATMFALMGITAYVLLISSNPQRMLLILLIFAIPFSLHLAFSPFGEVPQHSGGAQPGVVIFVYDLPVLGLFALRLIDVLLYRKPVHISAVDVAAVLLIIWSALTMLVAKDVELTEFEIIRLIKLYIMAHVIANSIKSTGLVRTLLVAFGITLLIQSVIAMLQYFFGLDMGLGFDVREYTHDITRVTGTVGWPNTFGAFVAALLCIPMALWICEVGGKWRPLLLILCLAGALPLVLTFSRGAWIAFAAGLVLICMVGWRAGWLGRASITRLVIIGFVALMASVIFAPEISRRAQEDTITVRTQLNTVAGNMIKSNPFLGIGLNNFMVVVRRFDTTGVIAHFPEPVHNFFLLTAAETGLVGFALFLLLIAMSVRSAIRAIKSNDRFLSATAIGLLAGMVVILVSNIGDVHLKTEVMFSLFWLQIGMTLALSRLVAPVTDTGIVPVAEPRTLGALQ
jgi:putative inorganic carbon (hco3(-)) transporter